MFLSFGESLKIARDKTGLTQMEVSKLTNLSQSQLSRYESNDSCPTADIIRTLAILYNVSADFLFGFQKSGGNGGIVVMETDVQLGLEQLLKLSPQNRSRTLGYMDALAKLEQESRNTTEVESDSDSTEIPCIEESSLNPED